MKQRIKINGITIIVGIAAIALFPGKIVRHSVSSVDTVMKVSGMGLVLLGQLLRVSARGHKAENSRSGHRLIKDGPYSMVRNPMYLGIILIGAGTVLFALELWVALLFGALFVLRYRHLFIAEEELLQRSFGQEYTDYKKKVTRLLPGFQIIFRKDIREYLPLKAAWFQRESLSIVLVLAACILIDLVKTEKLKGAKALAPESAVLVVVAALFMVFVLFLIKRDEKKAG
jgi:protein-S-isoprenylcysteine O-methyltransferase Ste14